MDPKEIHNWIGILVGLLAVGSLIISLGASWAVTKARQGGMEKDMAEMQGDIEKNEEAVKARLYRSNGVTVFATRTEFNDHAENCRGEMVGMIKEVAEKVDSTHTDTMQKFGEVLKAIGRLEGKIES